MSRETEGDRRKPSLGNCKVIPVPFFSWRLEVLTDTEILWDSMTKSLIYLYLLQNLQLTFDFEMFFQIVSNSSAKPILGQTTDLIDYRPLFRQMDLVCSNYFFIFGPNVSPSHFLPDFRPVLGTGSGQLFLAWRSGTVESNKNQTHRVCYTSGVISTPCVATRWGFFVITTLYVSYTHMKIEDQSLANSRVKHVEKFSILLLSFQSLNDFSQWNKPTHNNNNNNNSEKNAQIFTPYLNRKATHIPCEFYRGTTWLNFLLEFAEERGCSF